METRPWFSISLLCVLAAGLSAQDAGTVSRHDVIYDSPSPEPWEAMPVGGGDLSAMVRWDGSLRLHLSKSDAWGFMAPAGAPAGTRFFNNVSPGHVRISFEAGPRLAGQHFRQRLDLARGRVVLELGTARIAVWGHPRFKVLAVDIEDSGGALGTVRVELEEWRDTMLVSCAAGRLTAREVQTREARPHLTNTGMQDFFAAGSDPLRGRALGVFVVNHGAGLKGCAVDGLKAAANLPSGSRRVLIAASEGDLASALAAPAGSLESEHAAWWREYWSRSFIDLGGEGPEARLVRAYYVHLYTLGCVNRGSVPAKWDGGPGLLERDRRNWGLSEWVQEIRFTYWPLYAANQMEMARGLSGHYSRMLPYLERQTKTMWGLPGIWIPETVLPWGHAEDFALKVPPEGAALSFLRRDPARIPSCRFEAYNPYVAFLFTSGLELAWHYLAYYRYSGDEAFLRNTAYPLLRGVCEFVASLVKPAADGRYHLEPGNALETWWLVRDPADTLAGIAAIFPEFTRLARRYGTDAELRARCERIANALAEPPRGLWREDGRIAAAEDVYAPAAATAASWKRSNAENPALYRIAPFGLSGAGSSDYELARRSFDQRILPVAHGWSMDAIWAARLGLAEETAALLTEHLEKFQRFRYGGWTSNDSRVYPGGLSVTPFLDAGGVSAVALQEALLQSHNGVIRVLPATSGKWSGAFKLRAEGGFVVDAAFTNGRATSVNVRSLLGKECAIEVAGRVSRFPTRAGESYPVAAPSGGLALNEDNSHYFSTRAGRRLTPADVDSFVDQYAGTQVRELFLSPNSMRTSYASKVWDPIWHGYDPNGPDDQPLLRSTPPDSRKGARGWIHTAWQLNQDGIDVYARWIARARARGISPWLSMRMNDVHNTDDERSYIHGEFWRANPQLRRVPYRFGGLTDRAFDYGKPEVREHHMKLVRELAERYDFDGLELDWMRFGYHFQPGHESDGLEILTRFTADVRRILNEQAKKRGHPILLGARVPSRPQTALGLGYDPVRWAREGLVDMLVVTPFWASTETDIPIETWRQLLAGTHVTLAAGLEVLARAYPESKLFQMNSLETVRGMAASVLDRGADRVYLFNYMDSETAMEDLANYPRLLRETGSLQTLAGKPRRHAVTFADTWAPGEPRAAALPAACEPDRWVALRVHTGPRPEAGGVEARIGLEGAGEPEAKTWEVRVNGTVCRFARTVTGLKPGPPAGMAAYEVPLAALRRGYNLIEVHSRHTAKIIWAEIALGL